MIDIYICEDNISQLNLIRQYINNTILIEELDMKISLATSNPYKLLDSLSADNIGVFFLDINLHSDINGLLLAQKIRKLKPRCFIIFVTSHSEMCVLTFQYKVEALDFIIKDDAHSMKLKIHECLLYIADKHAALNNSIVKMFNVPITDRMIAIDYNDIIFFETSANIHKIILHTKERNIEFSGQLKEISLQLDSRFYRCHQSYLINISHIKEVNFLHGIVTMTTGDICPVSTRAKSELKKRLKN